MAGYEEQGARSGKGGGRAAGRRCSLAEEARVAGAARFANETQLEGFATEFFVHFVWGFISRGRGGPLHWSSQGPSRPHVGASDAREAARMRRQRTLGCLHLVCDRRARGWHGRVSGAGRRLSRSGPGRARMLVSLMLRQPTPEGATPRPA
eukprot:366157-Chlamydomonas_euryale.AAC.17